MAEHQLDHGQRSPKLITRSMENIEGHGECDLHALLQQEGVMIPIFQ
jgi:hypothetical protein